MSYLNELGTVLEMEKHYFDSQSKIILWDFRMNLTMISWMFAPCGFVCAMRKRKTTVGWNTQQ